MTKKYQIYTTFDKPIPYKGLVLYPALVKNYIPFYFFLEAITVEKNSIPDIEVISMTYLEYVYYSSFVKKEKYNEFTLLQLLNGLFRVCLRMEDSEKKIFFNQDSKGKPIFQIDDTIYNSEDFDAIKEIICEQNDVVLPDESVQKEIRDRIEEERRIKSKMTNTKIGTLEEQVIIVLVSTTLKMEDVENLSIRKFMRIIQRLDHKLHYEIYLGASVGGLAKFEGKNQLKHWMVSLEEEDQYGDSKIDLDQYQSKMK